MVKYFLNSCLITLVETKGPGWPVCGNTYKACTRLRVHLGSKDSQSWPSKIYISQRVFPPWIARLCIADISANFCRSWQLARTLLPSLCTAKLSMPWPKQIGLVYQHLEIFNADELAKAMGKAVKQFLALEQETLLINPEETKLWHCLPKAHLCGHISDLVKQGANPKDSWNYRDETSAHAIQKMSFRRGGKAKPTAETVLTRWMLRQPWPSLDKASKVVWTTLAWKSCSWLAFSLKKLYGKVSLAWKSFYTFNCFKLRAALSKPGMNHFWFDQCCSASPYEPAKASCALAWKSCLSLKKLPTAHKTVTQQGKKAAWFHCPMHKQDTHYNNIYYQNFKKPILEANSGSQKNKLLASFKKPLF